MPEFNTYIHLDNIPTGKLVNINIRQGQGGTGDKKYIGWRCTHEAEGGFDSDSRGMPEIRPGVAWNGRQLGDEPPPVFFTKYFQLLSWEMNQHNPNYTKNNWRVTYGNTTAFCNGQGYGSNPDRRDYVTPQDTDHAEDPKLMKAIICGGMFIRGEVKYENNQHWLYCTPGIHAINANDPCPPIEKVWDNIWYYVATTQYEGKMSHFPQGHGLPVYIPYMLREQVKYPLSWFQRWEEDYLPDPLAFYLPTVPVSIP